MEDVERYLVPPIPGVETEDLGEGVVGLVRDFRGSVAYNSMSLRPRSGRDISRGVWSLISSVKKAYTYHNVMFHDTEPHTVWGV